jgi:hypothetical protein
MPRWSSSSPGRDSGRDATRLAENGFPLDARAFVFTAIDRNLTDKLESGTFILTKNLTPNPSRHGPPAAKDSR